MLAALLLGCVHVSGLVPVLPAQLPLYLILLCVVDCVIVVHPPFWA